MPVAAIEGQLPLPRYEIEEDSTVFKALSCVPVLGVIPSLIQYSRLYDKTEKLVKSNLPYPAKLSRFIELIKVKYDYLKANSVNGLLCVAIAVSLLYFGIFTGLAFFPLLPFGLIFSTVNLYGCYSFKSDINRCQQMQADVIPGAGETVESLKIIEANTRVMLEDLKNMRAGVAVINEVINEIE